MDSIRFPTRDFFPLFEVPSTNTSTTPFSSHPEKEVLIAIPNGKKSYLWFTNIGEDVCFSVPRNFKTQPEWTEITTQISTQYPQPFYGTLLSGTLVYPPNNVSNSTQNMEYFVADDIFYYAGISLSKSVFCERLEYLLTFFHQYISIAPSIPITITNNKQIQIVLVNMRGKNEIPNKPIYRVHHWQLRNLSFVSPYYALSNDPPHSTTPIPTNNIQIPQNPIKKIEYKSQQEKYSPKKQWIFQYHLPVYKQKAIFKIIPEEQCDVYSIYARLPPLEKTQQQQQTEWVSCGYAGIFEYNTSKLLNYHCRNISSNHLDQLEESDDEEDSPPMSNPITPIAHYFECTFSAKFRKWVPLYFIPQCSPERVINIDSLAIYGENRPSRSNQTQQYHSQPHSKNRPFTKNK
jgi:hypothetical protein